MIGYVYSNKPIQYVRIKGINSRYIYIYFLYRIQIYFHFLAIVILTNVVNP